MNQSSVSQGSPFNQNQSAHNQGQPNLGQGYPGNSQNYSNQVNNPPYQPYIQSQTSQAPQNSINQQTNSSIDFARQQNNRIQQSSQYPHGSNSLQYNQSYQNNQYIPDNQYNPNMQSQNRNQSGTTMEKVNNLSADIKNRVTNWYKGSSQGPNSATPYNNSNNNSLNNQYSNNSGRGSYEHGNNASYNRHSTDYIQSAPSFNQQQQQPQQQQQQYPQLQQQASTQQQPSYTQTYGQNTSGAQSSQDWEDVLPRSQIPPFQGRQNQRDGARENTQDLLKDMKQIVISRNQGLQEGDLTQDDVTMYFVQQESQIDNMTNRQKTLESDNHKLEEQILSLTQQFSVLQSKSVDDEYQASVLQEDLKIAQAQNKSLTAQIQETQHEQGFHTSTSQPIKDSVQCIACKDSYKDYMWGMFHEDQTTHVGICDTCKGEYKKDTCPICNQPVWFYTKVYII